MPAMFAAIARIFALEKLAKKSMLKIEIFMIVHHSKNCSQHKMQPLRLLSILILEECAKHVDHL